MRPRPAAGLVLVAAVLAACATEPTATASPSPSPSPMPTSAPSSASATADATPASPTPSPEPTLSLALPDARDPRAVRATVVPNLDEGGGRIVVTVSSLADTRIDDLVLRWPTPLGETLVLAPFVPSEDRIRDGGPPLVQPWTKWVIGPGERGEPAGTISLGYGPLLPGATLEIVLYVTRVVPAPIAFDLQLLADNDLLVLEGGEPAELRIDLP